MEEPSGGPEEQAGHTADNSEGGAPESWRSIGERLRLAREASGLTLAEVAERTKVRPGILSDIEADAHERLPALTYSIGFVKAYARTVGVDPTEAGNAFRQEAQKLEPVPSMVDLQPLEARRLPGRGLLLLTGLLLLLLLGGFWAWGAGWFTPAPQGAVEKAVMEAEAQDPPDTGSAVATEMAAATPAADAGEEDQTVTLTATAEVWLRITDGADLFFTGILAPGQSLTLPEGRPWVLRTARGGAIDAKVGNRSIPSFGGLTTQLYDFPLSPDALLAWVAPPVENAQESE